MVDGILPYVELFTLVEEIGGWEDPLTRSLVHARP
jgi:hypothetical protein